MDPDRGKELTMERWTIPFGCFSFTSKISQGHHLWVWKEEDMTDK